VLKIAVQLTAEEWISAWRPKNGRLVLPTAAPPRLHQNVAARIQLRPSAVAATVLGTVVSAHRHEGHHRIEIATGAESDAALKVLDAAARGDTVVFQPRRPRFLVKLPAVVATEGQNRLFTTTVSVSEGGCALRWSGEAPRVGTPLALQLGVGTQAIDLRGVVCWRKAAGPGTQAGVRFLDGKAAQLRHLLADAKRAGAPET